MTAATSIILTWQPPSLYFTWNDIAERCSRADAPQSQAIWGVPRGGIHIAQVLERVRGCTIAEIPNEASVIVDDIYDSGRTCDEWVQRTGKPFWAAFDKRDPAFAGSWLVMPWEQADQQPPGEDHVARLLEVLGLDVNSEGLRGTPERVLRAFRELTIGYGQDPQVILSTRFSAEYDEMVILRDVEFYSLCEHHMLPFHGTATVAYLPRGQVVGLSKLYRLIDCYARRLQIQERMTEQISHALMDHLGAAGAACVIRATHLCMAMRGVKNASEMVTSSLLGALRTGRVRSEFLSLSGAG